MYYELVHWALVIGELGFTISTFPLCQGVDEAHPGIAVAALFRSSELDLVYGVVFGSYYDEVEGHGLR